MNSGHIVEPNSNWLQGSNGCAGELSIASYKSVVALVLISMSFILINLFLLQSIL